MIRKLLVFALSAIALSATSAPGAEASFGITPGTLGATLSTTQAGAHPDLTTSFMVNTHTSTIGVAAVDGNVKDVRVDLPAGLTGLATATPRCPWRDLRTDSGGQCPADSQVGVVTAYQDAFGTPSPATTAIFNMVPQHGRTAELGFILLVGEQGLVVGVRPDGGLETTIPSVSEAVHLMGASVTLWGVPALPVHDAQRGPQFVCFGDSSDPANCSGGGTPSTSPIRPFLTNPTQCTGQPLQAQFHLTSWQHPDTQLDYETPVGTITGCDKLHFDPKLGVHPSTRQIDSPTGLTVRVDVPQNDDPNGLATANLRRAVVTLPRGLTLSPAAADGLEACTDAQLGLSDSRDPTCPNASTLGTAVLHTPALPDELSGPIYLRPQTSDDPFRIVMVLHGDGVTLKIPGSVHTDPATGQVTTTFDDAPQQPFSDLELTFNGGPRAPLATPASCGTGTTAGTFQPWSASGSNGAASLSSAFDFGWDDQGSACPAVLPFAPGFSAGVTNPVAGANSPFVFRVTRDDRQQTLGAIDGVHMPAGLTADVTSVSRCANAHAATGTCGADSQIGQALVAAGAGSHPLQLRGKVYLTDGYKGAPFGLSIVVPAIAGPFDLGTVVVRASVNVNSDASLNVDADPLPTIISGIPLRLRDIQLELDRPGFMLNPTSCAPMSVTATVHSTEGAAATVSDPFQLADCKGMPFNPRIVATTTAGNDRKRGAALHVTITARPGDTNLRTVTFTLPRQFGANLNETKNACAEADYDAGKCNVLAKVGTAKAITGILPHPMTGDVYLVAVQHGLPKLGVILRGNGIAIPLVGNVSFDGTRTVTTFDAIPDVPITRFDLDLPMGATAVVTSTVNVCDARLVAPLRVTGQSGRTIDRSIPVKPDGCSLHVMNTRVRHRSALLRVGGIGPGTLVVRGAGIVRVKRTIKRSPNATILVKLTRSAQRVLARKGTSPHRVTITFTPTGGGGITVTKRVTFRK